MEPMLKRKLPNRKLPNGRPNRKFSSSERQNRKSKKSKKIFLLFCTFSCFLLVYTVIQSNARQHPAGPLIASVLDILDARDPEFDLNAPPSEELGEKVITGTIHTGETMATLLGDWLSTNELHDLCQATHRVFDLKKLREGQDYKITIINNTLVRFEYVANKTHYLEVDLDEGAFVAAYKPFTYEVKAATLHGTIRTTLCDAVGSEALAVRLTNIFGWEIDFARDLREGDSFSVYVEKRYHEDEFLGYGNILAAELNVRGKRYDAYRFQHADKSFDYYSSNGKSLGHFFLKTPVAFTRISSGFSLSRYHPITKTNKPHYGVDYAAPTGTPIYALGAGKLTQVEQNNASGRFVRIDHGNGYETAYLHMSRFARGMRAGKRVSQGELIGYVGQTGLATGPHLCFRMKKNGKPVDPTRIDVARAGELPGPQKQKFLAMVENIRPKLTPEYHYAKSEKNPSATRERVN